MGWNLRVVLGQVISISCMLSAGFKLTTTEVKVNQLLGKHVKH